MKESQKKFYKSKFFISKIIFTLIVLTTIILAQFGTISGKLDTIIIIVTCIAFFVIDHNMRKSEQH
ncbi:hypothetical protein [Virgibacillus ihumii]|uniref:hypothetical protein n=1 Tax=Virgibacillus ihumii TaxID=2686091 RepID=UPI00157E12D8|nr:hypothetical protein [Virgibacillus ihumii]